VTSGHGPARPPDPLDTSLLFEVFALNQAVGRFLADALREGPLSPAEYAIASAIFELEAASPTALAARLGMRLTTFIDHLRVLERRGLARRLPHPTDRRSYRVVLTAEGLAAHRAANQLFEAAHAAFVEALAGGTVRAREVLRAMREAADKVAASSSPPAVSSPSPSPRPSPARAG
jgi:DNA-binding MarR family transcriptional regulator